MPSDETDQARALGNVQGALQHLIKSVDAHHEEARESRRRMFDRMDQQGREIAVMMARIDLIEREVKPMQRAVEDYQTMKARIAGLLLAASLIMAVVSATLAHFAGPILSTIGHALNLTD